METPGRPFQAASHSSVPTEPPVLNDEIQNTIHVPSARKLAHVVDRPPTLTVEETERQRVERLGRERPPQFRSLWAEVLFVYSILASQFMAVSTLSRCPGVVFTLANLLSNLEPIHQLTHLQEYFVSGFNVLLPTLITTLHIPQASSVWPSGAFALTTSAFLLPFGRLSDIYGGYSVYLFGLTWFFAWSLIAGFSKNELMLDFCRALQGLGPAAFLPSGVQLMANIYRPGPRKNLVFSLYGASAPLGFFLGIFIAGVTGEFVRFGWYFWIGTILVFSTIVAAYLTVPSDVEQKTEARKQMAPKMDWLGTVLIVCGLILVVFSVTDANKASNGWRTPYIPVTLILGFCLLSAAFYVEGWVAAEPLIPFDLFEVPYLKPLFLALFFSYGCLGVFLLYATLYMEDVMGAGSLQVSAWYVPMAAVGVMCAVLGGHVLHLFPGTILVIVSALSWILTSVLFAVAPVGASYWAYIFPAMIAAALGIDLTFNVTNVFITTNLPSKRQGLAGALINTLVYLGIAFLLGLADVVQTKTARQGLRQSYRNVFWYQLGCSATALIILVFFVRITAAESDLTTDEKAAKEALKEEERGQSYSQKAEKS